MLKRTKTKDDFFIYCRSILGMSYAGTCGFMANIQAESHFKFDLVEYLLIVRYDEDGKQIYKRPASDSANESYNNALYTRLVDSGEISKAEFESPRNGHQYGYGVVQWTTPARKRRLWQNTIAVGKSIADVDGQLKTLNEELTSTYQSTLDICRTETDAEAAAEYVLRHFESPKITPEILNTRRKYAAEFAELYKDYNYNRKGETDMANYDEATIKALEQEAIEHLVATAHKEDGYLEKASAHNLDSKTANAGYANFTKYWKDVAPQYQGQYWCAAHITAVFTYAFDRELAKKMLLHYPYIACQTGYDLFAKAGRVHSKPKVGDIVVFYSTSKRRYSHTGLVVEVREGGNVFVSHEGNTNAGSAVVANGGGVYDKTYRVSNLNRVAFLRPNYRLAAEWLFSKRGSTEEPIDWTPLTTATVAAATAYIRSTPEITSTNHLVELHNGNRFEVNGEKQGQWVRVKSLDTIGWMHSSLIKYDNQPDVTADNDIKRVTTAAYVRRTAGVRDDNLVKTFGPAVEKGTEVKVEKIVKAPDGTDWAFCHILSLDKRGYIASWLLQ